MPAPKLLGQVRERIRVKHYSLHTEDAYLHWIRRFIFFHGKRHPREMGGTEVKAFLAHRERLKAPQERDLGERASAVRAGAQMPA